MSEFQLFGASLWRTTPANYVLTSNELICNENGTIRRFFLDDIRKIQISHHLDWRLRHFYRCRIYLSGRDRTQVHSDVTEAGKRALNAFYVELFTRAAKINPNVKILHGIDHVKWAVLFIGYLGIAAALLVLAPKVLREPISFIIVSAVMYTYLASSLITTVTNWPHYYLYTETKAGDFRGQALHGYLADQYEKYISPLRDLSVFLLNPSALASGIVSRDKNSFKLAVRGVLAAFLIFSVVIHALVWALSLKTEMTFPRLLTIEAALLIVPAACFICSFLLLRTVLKYEDLAPLEYLHAFLYPAALIVMVEVAAMTAFAIVENHVPDVMPYYDAYDSPESIAACSHASHSDCLRAKIYFAADRRKLRGTIFNGIFLATVVLWSVILYRFAHLTNIAFRIRWLLGYLANVSALIVVFLFAYFVL